MAIPPAALPALFDALIARVDDAAGPAVLAMAHTYERAVKRNLNLMAHPAFQVTESPPGAFPAKISGELSRSIRTAGPWGVAGRRSASVAPHVFYAGVQEYGHRMHAHGLWPMTWYMEGYWWSKRDVGVPARPYMRPTTIQLVANGDLTRAAAYAFEIAVWHGQ